MAPVGDAPGVPQVEQVLLVAVAGEQRAPQRLVRHVVADRPVELTIGPEIELQLAELGVARRPVDGVILAGQMIHGETPGDRLLVERIGLRQGMQLAGLGNRFGADHVLDAGRLEEVAGFRGIDHKVGFDVEEIAGLEVAHRDRGNAIAAGVGRDQRVAAQHRQPVRRS